MRNYDAFRRFWTARALSLLGDGVAFIALLLYSQGLTGSGLGVAGILLARAVPRLLGPIAGALADRYEQRTLLVSCDLAQAILYGAIGLISPSYVPLVSLVGGASIFQAISAPAGQAALPKMVGREDLGRANAWLGSALTLQVTVGPLVGGVIVAFISTQAAMLADSATFLASAACLSRMPPLRCTVGPAARGLLEDAVDGVRFVARDRMARPVIALIFFCSGFLAVDAVVLVFLVRVTLHGSPETYGFAEAAFGLGMIGVSGALLARDQRRHPARLLLAGLLLGGISYIATGLAQTALLVTCFQLAAGIGNGLESIATDTLVQTTFAPSIVGRIFGVGQMASYAATSVGTLAGGLLLQEVGARSVFIAAGSATILVVALLGPTIARRHTAE